METQPVTPEPQAVPKPALPLLALLALASVLGVAVAVALAGITMLLAAPAYAGDGSLVLERRGASAPAPLLFADREHEEHGPIVHTRVREAFRNPFGERLAALYLNRLPPDAELESFSISLLDEGAPEAAVASATRRAVLAAGESTALAERIVDIGPGETVLVEIEYRQVANYERSRADLRLLTLR